MKITQIVKVIPQQTVIEKWENIFVYMHLHIISGHVELSLQYIKKPASYMIQFLQFPAHRLVQTCLDMQNAQA